MAPTTKPKNTNQCQNLMLTALTAYYKKNVSNRKELFNIINGDTQLSLRLVDWFVTHYARINNIVYWIDDKTGNIYDNITTHTHIVNDTNSETSGETSSDTSINEYRKFNLYLDYRAQLQSYTKMFFDPFRRYSRITFILENEPIVSIETTVGQLNFFRWALQNGVVKYIINNITTIEEQMANFQKQNKPIYENDSSNNNENNVTNINNNNTNVNPSEYTQSLLYSNAQSSAQTHAQSQTQKKHSKTKLKTKEIRYTHTVTHVPCLIYFD